MNSVFFKLYLCFHSIIIFVVSCVLWDYNSKYIVLQSDHFTCLKEKTQQNRHPLIITINKIKRFINCWNGQKLFKLIIDEKKLLLLLHDFTCLCFECYISWSSYTMKTKTLVTMICNNIFQNRWESIAKGTREAPQIKK